MTEKPKTKVKNSMKKQIDVNDWVAMFREIGLGQEQMAQWHKVFEARHAADHRRFLEWLGVSADEINRIRAKSR